MLISSNRPPVWARLFRLAECDARRALPLARRALERCSNDQPERCWALWLLGWTLLRAERFNEAAERLSAARAGFEAINRPAEALDCRRALLILARLRGAGAELQAAWSELADAYTRRGRALDAARTRIHQAAHLNALGRPDETLALADTLQDIVAAEGTTDDRARLLRVMAVAHANLGAFETAERLLQESLRLFKALRYPAEVARSLFERAHLEQRRERLAAAVDDLRQALAIFTRLDLPAQIALCHKSIGVALARLGRYDEALARTIHARAAFVALGQPDQVAECELNLGLVAYYSGLWELALAAYRRAEASFHQLGRSHLELMSRRNQVYTLRAAGKFTAAIDLLQTLEQPARALGDAVEQAELAHLHAKLLLDLGDNTVETVYTPPLPHRLQQARACWTALGNRAGIGDCWLDEGFLRLAHDQTAAARVCFARARALLGERPAHLWRIDYGLGRCAQLEGDDRAALTRYQAASAIIAGLRGTLASEHASAGVFAQARELLADALGLAADLDDALAVLRLAEAQRAVALQRQLHGIGPRLPSELAARSNELRGALGDALDRQAPDVEVEELLSAYTEVLLHARHAEPPPEVFVDSSLDVPELQSRLDAAYPAGWIALTFAERRDELLIVTLTSRAAKLTRVPLDTSLRDALRRATLPPHRRRTYLLGQGAPGHVRWQTLAELGARLLPPRVRARLTAETRLLIMPSASLHALPWAALRIDDSWLCERAVIQLLPRLSLWPALVERPTPGREALLLGCSEFGARARALSDVTAELDQVAACWPGPVRRLEEAAATRETVLAMAARGQLRAFGLLHVTTHAQLVAARGLLAHIKLWDDDLLLDDVLRLDLAGAILVLAVCEGAASDVLPGDEVLSLSRAFLASGARDVVASLWPIYERAAQPILRHFYDRLASGADAPSALAWAQREALRDEGPAASPFIWAGLYAFGAGSAAGMRVGGAHTTHASPDQLNLP